MKREAVTAVDPARVASTTVPCGPADATRAPERGRPCDWRGLRGRLRASSSWALAIASTPALRAASTGSIASCEAVQAIVTHLERFPVTRARAACARAHFVANYTYQGVRNILQRALDLQPPLLATPPPPANDVALRFARPSASWALRIKEVSGESA